MNKQHLAARIGESANKMRPKIEANELMDYILGFIFYKFLPDKDVKYLKENDWTDDYLVQLTEEDQEVVQSVHMAVIENLSSAEAEQMLASKWIEPLVETIGRLPEIIVADFIGKLEALCGNRTGPDRFAWGS